MPDTKEWIKQVYFPYLGSSIATSINYLHTTLNWAVTLLLGSIVFVVSRSSFPDHIGLIGLLLTLLILNHFAIRTAKAYLSVMRFSILEKYILGSVLEANSTWPEIQAKIIDYHINWISPLRIWDVLYKVLFELGFIYFLLVIFLLLVYTISKIGISYWIILESLFVLTSISVEIWLGLVRTPYLRSIKEDWLARTQR
jgi:hypothetical protein